MRNVFVLFLFLFTAEMQGATAFESCAQLSSGNYRCDYFGMLRCTNIAVFDIVQSAFEFPPPHLSFEHF